MVMMSWGVESHLKVGSRGGKGLNLSHEGNSDTADKTPLSVWSRDVWIRF